MLNQHKTNLMINPMMKLSLALIRPFRSIALFFVAGCLILPVSCDRFDHEKVNKIHQIEIRRVVTADYQAPFLKKSRKKSSLKKISLKKAKTKAPRSGDDNLYMVQIAAFTERANAQKHLAKVMLDGYDKAFIHSATSLGTNSLHGIRLGRHSSMKEAAKQAKTYAKRFGKTAVVFKGMTIRQVFRPKKKPKTKERLIALPQKAPKGKEAPGIKISKSKRPRLTFSPKSKHYVYAFQVGGLQSLKNAQKLAKRLKSKGYAPTLNKVQDIHEVDFWYLVVIGYFYSPETALQEATNFNLREQLPTLVLFGKGL